MIYAHKILPLIASPLFFCIIIFALSLFLQSRKIGVLGLTILYLLSLPVISVGLISYLEKDYSLQKPKNSPSASAVVVLSGMVRVVNSNFGLAYEWTDASDRIFAGIDLMRLDKAPILVLTRGKVPWSFGIPEGDFLSSIAQKFGVKKNQIRLTQKVENTESEAKEVGRLIQSNGQKILLVTSAFHMLRAKKAFEKEGFIVICFPVDFRKSEQSLTPMSFIPSSGALLETSLFLREIIGRFYYTFKYRFFV